MKATIGVMQRHENEACDWCSEEKRHIAPYKWCWRLGRGVFDKGDVAHRNSLEAIFMAGSIRILGHGCVINFVFLRNSSTLKTTLPRVTQPSRGIDFEGAHGSDWRIIMAHRM